MTDRANAKYQILWNTGDDYWDNEPEVEYYATLENVIEEIELTEEQIAELKADGNVVDKDNAWMVEEL